MAGPSAYSTSIVTLSPPGPSGPSPGASSGTVPAAGTSVAAGWGAGPEAAARGRSSATVDSTDTTSTTKAVASANTAGIT